MDEMTFRKKMTAAIARINELPASRREELLALAERLTGRSVHHSSQRSHERPDLRRD